MTLRCRAALVGVAAWRARWDTLPLGPGCARLGVRAAPLPRHRARSDEAVPWRLVMKTDEVQDPGGGAAPYPEAGGWTPWQYYASADELERYYSTANALIKKL